MSEGDDEIAALRVAQSELSSGNTSGNVYIRLSEGAVAFLTTRSNAKEEIDAKLRIAIQSSTSPSDLKSKQPKPQSSF
jgi:hypothetical protein